MTKKIKELMNAKKFIEGKISLNDTLLQTIQKLYQDENTIIDENKMYNNILALIKKELREEYKKGKRI